jgi:hypothetical protein
MAAPMPRLAPVTMAFFPASEGEVKLDMANSFSTVETRGSPSIPADFRTGGNDVLGID